MSSEVWNQAILSVIRRDNDRALNYLNDTLTFLPSVGYVDWGNIIINVPTLSGDKANR